MAIRKTAVRALPKKKKEKTSPRKNAGKKDKPQRPTTRLARDL
ncbi:MAG TPA: hypothetical protein VLH41_00410 [Thermoanaerobaculia bacterium]|nr:hypothetical protein [Thermoanaerobaculia bacterium]